MLSSIAVKIIHGSFANTGFEPRLSINFGFHKCASVLTIRSVGMHAEAVLIDDSFIDTRSRFIGFAIDARRQRFQNETQYIYAPYGERQEEFKWIVNTQSSLKEYNLMDLRIWYILYAREAFFNVRIAPRPEVTIIQ